MSNLHNRYKSAENKFTEKQQYVKLLIAMQLQLKFVLLSIYNEATMDIEEISIFSDNSHLECISHNFERGHIGTAKIGLIWSSSSRGENLNVIFY